MPDAPAQRAWMGYILTGLFALVLVVLLVSVSVSTWRQLFPRPPAPTYVCVYISVAGTTTVTGSTPCPAP